MKVQLEFSGGAELLFDKIRQHYVDLPQSVIQLGHLLIWIKDNLLKERPELFLQANTVRPGILVLINDVDYSLLDEEEYVLCDGDRIHFISSLHGG